MQDVLREFPDIYPFQTPSPESDTWGRHTQRRGDPRGPFDAAVVFHDPVEWAPDLQVLIDCLQLECGVGRLGDKRGMMNEIVPVRAPWLLQTR